MASQELDGRTALVTGGARGIGRACCLALAEAGANVAVNFRSSNEQAEETARVAEEFGVRSIAIGADVSSPSEVVGLVSHVTEELGPIDLLVNNAGVFDYATHEETTLELWQRALDNNLTSAYHVTWAVKAGMIERGFGRIVNIASISGLRARPNSIAYAVSKAGMIALTKSLAEAVADKNLRVNAVAPGLIDTEILGPIEREVLDGIVAATPIPRIGKPEEIAELVLFLLSERSSFMTGQTLVASGGRVMLP